MELLLLLVLYTCACSGRDVVTASRGKFGVNKRGYTNNTNRQWLIQLPRHSRVQLRFVYVDVESGKNGVCYDYIGIYDGTNTSAPLLARVCGKKLPQDVFSSRNSLLVVFKTDYIYTWTGFKIKYKAKRTVSGDGCDGNVAELRGPSGQFGTTGSHYDNGMVCKWKLSAKAKKQIRLHFITFDVESNEGECSYDRVKVYNGDSPSAPLIDTYCGSDAPKDVISSGNALFVTFESDSSETRRGFRVDYSEQTITKVASDVEGCNGVPASLIKSSGKIGFIGFKYDMSCSWKITVDVDQHVVLHFTKFAGVCRDDKVKVYDGDSRSASLLKTFYGGHLPADVTSSGSQLFITFHSGKRNPEGVLWLRYRAADPPPECGVPAIPSYTSRIVGGKKTTPHAWPWQISFVNRTLDVASHICGGTILSDRWVITAAHCVHISPEPSMYVVVVGKHNITQMESTQSTHELEKIYEHPEYNTVTKNNDLALLKMKERIKFTREVSPVCLPDSEDLLHYYDCKVTGWGMTRGTGDRTGLRQLDVPLIDTEKCNGPTWYRGKVSEFMLCAGHGAGGKDACQGDSGGPLVCSGISGVWKLIGVTSWGTGCARRHRPGVYVRMTRFVDWVNRTMTENEGPK